MSERAAVQPQVGDRLLGRGGRTIGRVDAVFADYLLVRSGRLLPVDLYVPVTAFTADSEPGTVTIEAESGKEAYRLWHRPLKRAPHD